MIVDKLRFKLLLYIWRKNIKEIYYLDALGSHSRFLIIIWALLGVRVKELEFSFSEIERASDTSLYAKGVELADCIAKGEATHILSAGFLKELNSEHKRNTLKLHLSKCHFHDLLNFSLKVVLVTDYLQKANTAFIEKPWFLSSSFVDRYPALQGMKFYRRSWSSVCGRFNRLSQIARIMMLQIYVSMRSVVHPCDLPAGEGKVRVLSPKEDTFGSDDEKRRQQFWTNGAESDFDYFVLNDSWKFNDFSRVVVYGNSYLMPRSVFGMALRQHKKKSDLHKYYRGIMRRLFVQLFTIDGSRAFACANAMILFLRSRELASIAEYLDIDSFVFKETHNAQTDAVQLVARKLGVTTIAMQYSNLLVKNCLMQTTADRFLMFSDFFSSRFVDDEFKPEKLISTGYPYRQIFSNGNGSAKQIRASLADLGAKTIIGYFDETITEGKYGQVNNDSHLHEVVTLAEFVLRNKEVAVILKPQFTRNQAAILYAEHETIGAALKTGRLTEACSGDEVRNNIYPATIGRVADLCIGNALGATAILEAVLNGCRGAVINPCNMKIDWRHTPPDVIFQSLEHVIKRLEEIGGTELSKTPMGDWAPFIRQFDPHDDTQSLVRIQREIRNTEYGVEAI